MMFFAKHPKRNLAWEFVVLAEILALTFDLPFAFSNIDPHSGQTCHSVYIAKSQKILEVQNPFEGSPCPCLSLGFGLYLALAFYLALGQNLWNLTLWSVDLQIFPPKDSRIVFSVRTATFPTNLLGPFPKVRLGDQKSLRSCS